MAHHSIEVKRCVLHHFRINDTPAVKLFSDWDAAKNDKPYPLPMYSKRSPRDSTNDLTGKI